MSTEPWLTTEHQRILSREILNLYYRFDPSAWGHGHATEAVRAIADRFAVDLPQLPVVARVATGKRASVSVARRCGLAVQDALDPQEPHDPVAHGLYASAPLQP